MKFYRITTVILLTVLSQVSFAEPLSVDYKPHYDTTFGVNYHQNWISARPGWGQLFVRTQPGFNFYFGWRFHPNLAGELGYEWSANKPLATTIGGPNQSFLGVTNTGVPVSLTGKVRFKTGHADLNLFFPLLILENALDNLAPEGIFSVGVGSMKPHIKIKSSPETAFSNNFTAIDGRSKAVFRVGFGIQTLLVEDVGARIIGRYENTSILRATGSVATQDPSTRVIFRNGVSLAVGLFVKF